MSLTLRTDYWDDPEATRAFLRFMTEIHRLDLARWREAGCWDRAYRPFSLFDGERVVSSVCVYSLPMVVRGREARVAQVSAVGTVQEQRRKGLGRRLMEIAEEWARPAHAFFFLLSEEDAVPFYRELDYRPVSESRPVLEVRGHAPSPGLRALDARRSDHLERIHALARARAPVSRRLGVLSASLLMFHVLYTLRDRAFYVPELGVVVFLRREGARLTIHDVVGPSIPTFRALYPFVAAESDREVAFDFWPDRLGVEDDVRVAELPDHLLHVKGEFDASGPVLFPLTSHA